MPNKQRAPGTTGVNPATPSKVPPVLKTPKTSASPRLTPSGASNAPLQRKSR
jgi:hypothetical protein